MGQIVDNCGPSGSSLQSTHETIKFGTKLSQEEEDSCKVLRLQTFKDQFCFLVKIHIQPCVTSVSTCLS